MKPPTDIPPELFAAEPPEARGLARDQVRLLVASPAGSTHTTFGALPDYLDPGDLLVVNTSATRAAAVDGHRTDRRPVTVHFASPLPDSPDWLVELRTPDRHRVLDAGAGERIALPGGRAMTLASAWPDPAHSPGSRIWIASVDPPSVGELLEAHGRAISYDYVTSPWPLSYYQTAVARTTEEPGSAEMPSAARPLTPAVLAALAARGVAVAPLVLHTGVSSLEQGEHPLPERYRVPSSTARLVNYTRRGGNRIVAVGTTVTRALESAVGADGLVHPAEGWTHLILGPDRPARVVDGLITGWHEPQASHWQLLCAVAPAEMVAGAYAAALEQRYRWHEFGDSCLLLPQRVVSRPETALGTELTDAA